MDDKEFRILAEHSMDLICLVRADLIMDYVSPASIRLLGWQPSEMEGKGSDEFVHPQDMPHVAAAYEAVAKHGTALSPAIVRMKKKTGGYAWMEMNARLISGGTNADGRVALAMRPGRQRGDPNEAFEPGRAPATYRLRPDIVEAYGATVITGVDLYITEAGNIAFVDDQTVDANGELVYQGYILDKTQPSGMRNLQWLPGGECVSLGEERHRVIKRV